MGKSYITFKKIEDKPKTSVFAILSKSNDDILGIVKWYAPWRQYCFFPENDTLWNPSCMKDVREFILGLMSSRKRRNGEE